MTRTAFKIALLVVLTTGLSVGTSGFSTVEAARSVNVNGVDNENAYVGVVACEKSNGNGNGASPVRVWVTNRYTDTVTVEEISNEAVDRTDGSLDTATVSAGERERFETVFDVPIDTVIVRVTADGFDATVTRHVAAKSACPYATATNATTGEAGGE
ncbi:hypothetical protein [Halobaculum gomorrense]|uniref:Uncharacterized protein n=1 Tax=Halobaculum gomorrense TaxID=43928 RepID=A0A1M5UFT3_9EURY|nr:hypothetical protein [Halobaculum gomorrense]SHH61780.1 hypothetical protein SAMN05443636_3020 [Halobaculum gomorrense]